MKKITKPIEIKIKPEGETHEWNFHTGSWCGQAHDSVGISVRGLGCTMLREDVKRLREFLQQAEATWQVPAPEYNE